MNNPCPTNVKIVEESKLLIKWSDGQRRHDSFREQRDACPCATCWEKRGGEHAAQTRLPVLSAAEAKPLRIEGMKPFGTYAYTVAFSDGNDTDIFSFELLRDNIGSMAKVGFYNLPLVKYLVRQGTQSMTGRQKVLRDFYPDARADDWQLVNAGIRVQAIKKEDGEVGIVHYGTEVVTDADKTIYALLGASPGASVSVFVSYVMLEVLMNCLPPLLETKDGMSVMKQMIPTYDADLIPSSAAERFRQVRHDTDVSLQLSETVSKSARKSRSLDRIEP